MYVVESCTHREVLRIHTNAAASKKYPISESVLISHMKVMYGETEIGKMRFCEPYSCMEPILEFLETKKLFRNKNQEYDFEFTGLIYNNVCGAKVDLIARLGKSTIKVNELLDLKIGDVIALDSKANGDIELDVSEARAFKCRPGLIKNKNGVVITDNVKKGV